MVDPVTAHGQGIVELQVGGEPVRRHWFGNTYKVTTNDRQFRCYAPDSALGKFWGRVLHRLHIVADISVMIGEETRHVYVTKGWMTAAVGPLDIEQGQKVGTAFARALQVQAPAPAPLPRPVGEEHVKPPIGEVVEPAPTPVLGPIEELVKPPIDAEAEKKRGIIERISRDAGEYWLVSDELRKDADITSAYKQRIGVEKAVAQVGLDPGIARTFPEAIRNDPEVKKAIQEATTKRKGLFSFGGTFVNPRNAFLCSDNRTFLVVNQAKDQPPEGVISLQVGKRRITSNPLHIGTRPDPADPKDRYIPVGGMPPICYIPREELLAWLEPELKTVPTLTLEQVIEILGNGVRHVAFQESGYSTNTEFGVSPSLPRAPLKQLLRMC